MSETPIITPTPEPNAITPTSFVQNEKRNYFYPALFIFLFLITLGSSIFFFIKTQSLSQQLALLKPSPTPTPLASADPTSSWQTFTHSTYKYQFKYPQTWSVSVSKNASANVYFGLDTTPMTGQGGIEIREINGDPKKFHDLNREEIENQQLITIASGISGYKSQIVSSPKGSDFVFKNADGLIYHIFINSTEPKDIEIFDQILSTFKFTDTLNTYTCPPSGYADCMPGPDAPKPSCTKEAMAWYEANCPNFQGGAL